MHGGINPCSHITPAREGRPHINQWSPPCVAHVAMLSGYTGIIGTTSKGIASVWMGLWGDPGTIGILCCYKDYGVKKGAPTITKLYLATDTVGSYSFSTFCRNNILILAFPLTRV